MEKIERIDEAENAEKAEKGDKMTTPRLLENPQFLTSINYIGEKKKSREELALPDINNTKIVQTFFEIRVPKFDMSENCFPIPVDLRKITKNAFASITNSTSSEKENRPGIRFDDFLKGKDNLKELIDYLVADSFWLIIVLFQIKNIGVYKKKKEKTTFKAGELIEKLTSKSKEQIQIEESKKLVPDILKRMSRNYFKFFIRICDLGPTRQRDRYLNEFRNYMSFSVFYSIYLSFPKSRHLFGDAFRNRLSAIFSYLFSGIMTEGHFFEYKWELDLGKGNIIEKANPTKEEELILPEVSEIQRIVEGYSQLSKYKKSKTQKGSKKKEEVCNDLLNTPLYRLYAELNKFETLNLLKPTKMANTKIVDIASRKQKHLSYVKAAKDAIKRNIELKEKFEEEDRKRNEVYNEFKRIIKANDERVKSELKEIKLLRVQEYANYLLFINK